MRVLRPAASKRTVSFRPRGSVSTLGHRPLAEHRVSHPRAARDARLGLVLVGLVEDRLGLPRVVPAPATAVRPPAAAVPGRAVRQGAGGSAGSTTSTASGGISKRKRDGSVFLYSPKTRRRRALVRTRRDSARVIPT